MAATTEDTDLARLDDDGCPHPIDAERVPQRASVRSDERPVGLARRLVLAALALTLAQTGCRAFRDDQPSARYEPPGAIGSSFN